MICARTNNRRRNAETTDVEYQHGNRSAIPAKVIVAETNALAALKFYAHNYTNLRFAGLGAGNKHIVLGSKPFQCRFCGGKSKMSSLGLRPTPYWDSRPLSLTRR
jgi:hypothetical protein